MYRSGAIVFLLLCTFSFTLIAQKRVLGIVTEKNTGTPIAFATVQVKDAKSTLTNESGEFEINVTALPVSITISHLNYQSVTIQPKNNDTPLKITLDSKVLTLKEVAVGNPAIAIMQDASDKALKNARKSNFGKAFLRQIAYDDGKPVYLNEIFLDAEWRPYGLIAWHPTQARHLESSKGLSYTNFSYYSFLLSGYLPNSVHQKPLVRRVDSLYTFKLAGTYDQDGQEIAKITCTPKPVIKKGQRFEGTYYVNTVTNNVLKIEGVIKGVVFTGGGPVSIKNIETIFAAQYRLNKEGDNVLDYSLLNSTNKMRIVGFGIKNTDLYSTLYMVDEENTDRLLLKELTPKIDDTNLVKAITYNADFWKNNQGIKRTEKEQNAIEILEKIPQVKN